VSLYYTLDADHKAIPTDDVLVWARWFENINNRIVAKTVLPNGIRVSTVCLGADHAFGGGPPLIFESMSFGDADHDEMCERYSTWDEAVAGHAAMVEKCKAMP